MNMHKTRRVVRQCVLLETTVQLLAYKYYGAHVAINIIYLFENSKNNLFHACAFDYTQNTKRNRQIAARSGSL